MTPPPRNDGADWSLAAWGRDLHVAVSALTRLPVQPPPASASLDPRARRAYPIAGALMGLAAGGVFFASHDVGLPAAVSAILAVAALILIGGHLEDGQTRAAAPFMVATLLKIAAIYVIGGDENFESGPHVAVLALVAVGALSHAAAILLEPAPDPEDEADANAGEDGDPRVLILPPDGTAIPADEEDHEGNGHELGPAATALAISLIVAVVTLGLTAGAVAAGGAALGAWLAPRAFRQEIESGHLPMPLALQQSGEVWGLLALAVSMSI